MNVNLKNRNIISNATLYSITLAYLLFAVFVLPSAWKNVATVLYALVMIVAVLAQKPADVLSVRLPRGLLACLLALSLDALLSLVLSSYSHTSLFITTAFLFLIALLFGGGFRLESHRVWFERLFFILSIVIAISSILFSIQNGNSTFTAAFYDKNFMGIVLFLLFGWCWVNKHAIGMIACATMALFLGSRNYIIMLVLFAVLAIWARRGRNRNDSNAPCLRPRQVMFIFIAMFVSIVLFSFWWSDVVVNSSGFSIAHNLNDSSNAIRFSSDRYAIAYFMEHPELALYGYDNDILSAMRIIEVGASDSGGYWSELNGAFYNGFRVVQPHHVILNMLLRYGAVYTVAYYCALSYIFSRYFNRNNACIWLPYLFGCMFMHSLLSSFYLLMLLVILAKSIVIAPNAESKPTEKPSHIAWGSCS